MSGIHDLNLSNRNRTNSELLMPGDLEWRDDLDQDGKSKGDGWRTPPPEFQDGNSKGAGGADSSGVLRLHGVRQSLART